MRKQTKIAVGLSAAALLAIGASMTAFAARGWVQEGGNWYYYDNNGEAVTNKWKNYNGNYFYLGDDGAMLTNQLVEDDNSNYYFVDANGAMVRNAWIPVAVKDDEEQDVDYRWYRFGSTGKAYKASSGSSSKKVTIDGKKYRFDSDGKMLFGFVDAAAGNILNNEEDAILNCTNYHGSNDDGAEYKGWIPYYDGINDSAYDDLDVLWFYFKPAKVTSTKRTINGNVYQFDSNGVMQSKMAKFEATKGGPATTGWFHTNDEGNLAKKSWIWTDKDINGNDMDDSHWFYAQANGSLTYNCVKKINGKRYLFDDEGKMVWGLVVCTQDGSKYPAKLVRGFDSNHTDPANIDSHEVKEFTLGSGQGIYYFSNDEEKDGAMKTGTIKIELEDDTFTFGFHKTYGCALQGYDSKTKKVYNNGLLLDAENNNYKKVSYDGKYYLVNNGGSTMKAGVYKDADDIYWAVAKSYNVTSNNADGLIKSFDDRADAKEWQSKN